MVSGCGNGGTVASNQNFPLQGGLAYDEISIGPIAAGPSGEVAFAWMNQDSLGQGCNAGISGGPSWSFGNTSCTASVNALAFDPSDRLLYGFSEFGGPFAQPESGFVGEGVTESFSFMGPEIGSNLDANFLGADAAGNLFVQVEVATPGVNFGLGVVSGAALLHYDPSGVLVSDTLPVGELIVGTLGDLFYVTSVTGTVDEGCGIVGAPSVTSTVVTERDTTGACLWSKALPAGTFVAIDPVQDVLLATTFAGTVDFGGGPLTSVGTSDLAIAKLDPSGEILWSKSFGASGASVTGIAALGATNSGGETLVVGLSGAVDFGCGAVSSSPGASTLFVSFDATGTVVYSRTVSLASFSATGFEPGEVGQGNVQLGPVIDGLGGISYALLESLTPGVFAGPGVVVSRFAP